MRVRSAFTLVLAAFLPGCLPDASAPGESGSFNASVTGDVSATFQGVALFGSEAGEGFSLVLTNATNTHVVAFARLTVGRPGVGSHPIVDTEEAAVSAFIAAYARQDEAPVHFVSESGTIQITSTTSKRIEGTFTFEAVGSLQSDPDTELRVTVTGTFDALCAAVSGAVCS